jgi:hypothetical protein
MTSVWKRKAHPLERSTNTKPKVNVDGGRMKGLSNEEIQVPEIFITISCLPLTLNS